MGDYLFQTSWMANEKTKRFLPALIHATIYSLPFLLIAFLFMLDKNKLLKRIPILTKLLSQ
jgi:hypothetical protein